MLGIFNPESFENLLKQEKSGLNKSIQQINKTLGTFYTVKDFVDPKTLGDIKKKWTAIPLGLSESDRQKYLEMSMPKKQELIIKPSKEKVIETIKEQKEIDKEKRDLLKEEKKAWDANRKSSLPASPFIPEVDQTITAGMAPVIDPTSGLTGTQEAVLTPFEKQIAKRQNQGIMGLV